MTRLLWPVLFALLWPLCALAQDDGQLLKNPSFDVDANGDNLPDGWSTSEKQIRRQEIVAFSKSYEIISQPGTYVLATQDVRLKKGQQYNLVVRARGQGGALMGALILHGPEKPEREHPIIWNVEVGDKYEDYIAVFKAPDPACRLYLYNVSRKDTIYYDSISLREGAPDQLIIQQLSLPAVDRPITDPPVTPHIAYARPLAGGPLRTFICLRSFRSGREVVELGQRLEMDTDVLSCGYEGDEVVSETGRRAMGRLAENYYEVYLVASKLQGPIVKTIQERVRKGAGLVVVSGFGQVSGLLDPKQLTEAPADHVLRRNVPFDLMPEKILTSVQTGQLGNGRVARLTFPIDISRVWGLIPIANDYTHWQHRQFAYWEGWLSLIARAMVWAGRGESGFILPGGTPVTGAEAALTLASFPVGTKARVVYRSAREIRFDVPDLRLPPKQVSLEAGRLKLAAPAELPAGEVLADVSLLNADGQTADWGTFVLNVPRQVRLAGLEADRVTYRPGERVKLALKLDAPRAVDLVAEGKLIDAFGRDVAVARLPVKCPSGEQMVTLTLPVQRPICVQHKAFVRLLVGGREQDSDYVPVRVPELGRELALSDFVATTWGPSGLHPNTMALFGAQTRALGLNSEFAINQFIAGEHGMLAAGYSGGGGAFREESHTGDVRRQCLSDPAVVAKYTGEAKKVAADQAPEGPFAAGITDEAFLSYHNERQELCWSPFCVARFQKWLQARYPSLEALNAQWGTAYKSWEEVRGAKTEEIRGQSNFGRFVDFRTFMTDVWVDACKTITDAYHEVSPEVPMGHTNTFGVNPFNGNDYWKLATQTGFGWGQEYSEAIKASATKAIFDPWRSFVETPEARRSRTTTPATADKPFFNYGWIGYDRQAVAAHYEPWWLALHDSRGVSYYATTSYDPPRGHSWALVYPNGSHTLYSQAVLETLADLRGGIGKVLMSYERRRPKVGLLWSHPSMLVAWCESKELVSGDPYESDPSDAFPYWYMSALNFRQHLNESQLDYEYVTPEQILKSPVLKQYPVLILPFTIAASPELVASLEQYVRGGGLLIGDLRCLRTDEHGKPFADSAPLQRLFGVTRGGTINYGPTEVTLTPGGEKLALFGREELTLAGGQRLGCHATNEPAVVVNTLGSGRAIYLNFKLPKYDATLRRLLAHWVAEAGVKPEVTVEAAQGAEHPRCYEINTFASSPAVVHGIIRDFRRCKDSEPVRVKFDHVAHLYDVRARKYLGKTDTTDLTLPPGETAVYALLPYRVQAISTNLPARVEAGQELAAQVALLADGKPADHVAHIELVNPQGQPVWEYKRNVVLAAGKGVVRVPLALNERPGQWTLRVRDVLTNAQTEAKFAVVAP